MKISNSKKQLARIISDNGGWPRNADWATQCKSDSTVSFYYGIAPYIEKGDGAWHGDYLGAEHDIDVEKVLPNWHQTILPRDEYFHLYPASDADGWIEWNGGECPVDKGTLIDVKWRTGVLGGLCCDELMSWAHTGRDHDIIAYRLHKPEQAKHEYCESVMRSIPEPGSKPTIEQLAAEYRNRKDYAERKQQEADAAKADAGVKLAELVAAGKAVGLEIFIAKETTHA